jgi:quercetin dioxygenase-like cupin family protein
VEYSRVDNRGKLIQPISWGNWKQLNILCINRKEVFGGHYHKIKTEFFYILSGRVWFNDMDLQSGDCLVIEPGDMHTIEAIEDSVIIELLSETYDKLDVYTKEE